MNLKQSTKRKLPWIHYVFKHKFQAVNTHKIEASCDTTINIKHEYEPLMCTHEFEIKHASKTCLSS